MKTIQNERLNMEMSVRDLLILNIALVNNFPGFSDLLNALVNGILKISKLIGLQVTDKKGLTVIKQNLKLRLVRSAHEMSARLVLFSRRTGNEQLYSEVFMTETSLKNTSDNVLKEKVFLLCERASEHISELADLGVNETYVEDLKTLMNHYAESAMKPHNGIKEKKQITAMLDSALKENNIVLNDIDILVETMRYSEPEFYSAYHERRKMTKRGGHSIAVKASVLNSESNEPLKGAHVKLLNAEDASSNIIERRTSEKGGVYVKNLNEGRYMMMVSLAGFEPKEVEFFVTDTEITRLRISLNKRLSA
jgi:hypothetical protein